MKYTDTHEWILIDNNRITIGITEFAAHQLGDVVFVELPAIGHKTNKNSELVVIESVKAASDILAPCSGTVVAVNDALQENPALINQSPLDSGWIVTLEVDQAAVAELNLLMDAAAYQQHTAHS